MRKWRLARLAAGFLRKDFLIETSYRSTFIFQMLGILASAFVWYFIARIFNPDLKTAGLEGIDYFSYLLFGLAFHRYLSAALASYASRLRNEQLTGTLEAMLASPTGAGSIVLGSSLWDFVMASLQVLGYILVGWAFFGVHVHLGNFAAFLLLLLLTIAAFSGIGVVAGAIVLYLKRSEPVTFLVSAVSALLGGVFYPPEGMPGWMEQASRLLPITWALRGVRRALLRDSSLADVLPEIQALLVFVAVLVPLGLACFHLALRRARSEGSLVQY